MLPKTTNRLAAYAAIAAIVLLTASVAARAGRQEALDRGAQALVDEEALAAARFHPSLAVTEWEKNFAGELASGDCATTTVRAPLYRASERYASTTRQLVFTALECVGDKAYFGLGEVNSGFGLYSRNENGGEERRFGEYWILAPGETAEEFLSRLVAVIPDPDKRAGCAPIGGAARFGLASTPYGKVWQIAPSQEFLEAAERANPDDPVGWDICGEYGPTNGGRLFLELDDTLVFLELGQDVKPYDFTSFRVENRGN